MNIWCYVTPFSWFCRTIAGKTVKSQNFQEWRISFDSSWLARENCTSRNFSISGLEKVWNHQMYNKCYVTMQKLKILLKKIFNSALFIFDIWGFEGALQHIRKSTWKHQGLLRSRKYGFWPNTMTSSMIWGLKGWYHFLSNVFD